MRRHTWRLLILVFGCVVAIGSTPHGHTPISSRWNYNEHLFPIFRDQCGSCHTEGGIAPMSLVTYQEAYPWTQSIREEILGLRMPPWQAEDGFGSFRNGHALSARDMDMILEWSSGGYPQGPRDQAPPAPEAATAWTLGEPELTLEMSEPFTIDAGVSETVRYFVLPAEIGAERSIDAVDFRPGARPVVRSAAVFLDATGAARALDEAEDGPGFGEPAGGDFPAGPPIALWIPGQEPVRTDSVGYPLPPGGDVVLRVHYKKTWITEGQEFSDRSRLGLYFSDGGAAEIASMLVASPEAVAGRTVTFSHDVEQALSLLAILPEVDVESSEIRVEAVRPDGGRIPMLWLREPDSSWTTRFWFDAPVNLPAGSRIEVTTVLDPGAERRPSASLLGSAADAPIRMALDYVAGAAAAN